MNASGTREKSSEPKEVVGLVAGLLLLYGALVLPAPEGLSPAGWRTAGVGLLMAVWWVTEAIPIPATSLAPLVLFPVLGVVDVEAAARPYAHPLIFLFMGGFMIALAMERWGLPRRISLRVVQVVGTRPRRLVAGFMASTAFFSMWVSNTATTLMMLPIGLSVIELVEREAGDGGGAAAGTGPERVAEKGGEAGREPGEAGTEGAAAGERRVERGALAELDAREEPELLHRPFSVALMLGIAYAASIGGLGTLIGTPPNAFLAGYLSETFGYEISFVRWMGVGLPLVIVALPLTYLLLTRWLFRFRLREIPGGRELIHRELRELGPVTQPERRVAVVFGLTALLWVTRPLLTDLVPGLSDAGIAVTGALLLFLIPAGAPPPGEGVGRDGTGEVPGEGEGGGHGTALLSWPWARRLPWGVLLLFGGGLSLASAIASTGLTGWIGEQVGGLVGVPVMLLVALVSGAIVLLTELTSNTATTAAFVPVVGSVALGIGQDPLLLVVPATLAASCAFMLPVATPPNAIVYGSGRLTISQMARAGVWLNALFVLLVAVLAYLLLPVVFGVDVGVVPAWAG